MRAPARLYSRLTAYIYVRVGGVHSRVTLSFIYRANPWWLLVPESIYSCIDLTSDSIRSLYLSLSSCSRTWRTAKNDRVCRWYTSIRGNDRSLTSVILHRLRPLLVFRASCTAEPKQYTYIYTSLRRDAWILSGNWNRMRVYQFASRWVFAIELLGDREDVIKNVFFFNCKRLALNADRWLFFYCEIMLLCWNLNRMLFFF